MKLLILKISKLAFVALAFTLFLTSCEKDNVDFVKKEVVDTFNPIMKVTIGNETKEYNAYATYCTNDDGLVFLNVSNNQLLLDTAIILEDFMVNDFLIYYTGDGTDELTIGGATFTENIGGVEFTSVVLDPAAMVTIEEANEEYVKGSMTGVFQLFSGEEVDYSVEFTAEVIAVSPFCD
jgi:hypothetical protein